MPCHVPIINIDSDWRMEWFVPAYFHSPQDCERLRGQVTLSDTVTGNTSQDLVKIVGICDLEKDLMDWKKVLYFAYSQSSCLVLLTHSQFFVHCCSLPVQVRCSPFYLSMVTRFRMFNNSLADSCLLNPQTLVISTAVAPTPPSIVVANSSVTLVDSNTLVLVVNWVAPASWGSCEDDTLNYFITVICVYNKESIIMQRIDSSKTMFNVSFQPSGGNDYNVILYAQAANINSPSDSITLSTAYSSEDANHVAVIVCIAIGSVLGLIVVGMMISNIPAWYRRRGYTM